MELHNWLIETFYSSTDFLSTVFYNIFPYIAIAIFIIMIILCIVLLTGWFWVRAIDAIRCYKKFRELYFSTLTKDQFEEAFEIFWEDFRPAD